MEISEFRKVEKMPKMYIFCQVQWQDHDWAKRTYNTKFYANQEQELKQIIKKLRFFSAVQHPGDLVLTKSFFLKANLLPIMSFFRKEVRNAKCEFLQNYNDKIKSWEDKENVKKWPWFQVVPFGLRFSKQVLFLMYDLSFCCPENFSASMGISMGK